MRDSAVDLVKAFCLLVVVGLHAMMAGVTVGADGLVVTNALAGHPIFAWATWGVQIMPLFFLLGGFASIGQWRRMRDNGAVPADYIRQRVNRLARPAILPIALIGATLATLVATGVSSDVLAGVGFRIGQPLWFLAVYLGCSAFVPLLTALHEAAPRLTLFSLLGVALAIDTISVTFALPALSAVNFLYVWLFIQQLGFWYADGAFSRLPRWLATRETCTRTSIHQPCASSSSVSARSSSSHSLTLSCSGSQGSRRFAGLRTPSTATP